MDEYCLYSVADSSQRNSLPDSKSPSLHIAPYRVNTIPIKTYYCTSMCAMVPTEAQKLESRPATLGLHDQRGDTILLAAVATVDHIDISMAGHLGKNNLECYPQRILNEQHYLSVLRTKPRLLEPIVRFFYVFRTFREDPSGAD